jgi:FAD/FMN-containing dehydrogenase
LRRAAACISTCGDTIGSSHSIRRRERSPQAGATWRQVQERIDPADLSVEIMQSYANFTIGGSLSVNGHGRYVGRGPLIRAVKSLKIVLADGTLVQASPDEHEDIFYGAIGGYGGLGVITEATIALTDNVRVKRTTAVMPISEYLAYFRNHVRGQTAPVFHNANIFPDDYSTVRAVTQSRTDDPLTNEQRLVPVNQPYRLNRLAFWIQSEWPLGRWLQRRMIDPWFFAGEPVTWRNYEASRDVAELEPATRRSSTYLLQEYFVPIDRFDAFVSGMRSVLQDHDVNVVNVSVRHAIQDPGSLLAWARSEVFAFVIYYKQRTDPGSRRAAEAWTRDLIDVALNHGGSYYLPYQIHATGQQFRRAYPNADRYFALKARLDPTNKFRNQLLDAYAPLQRPH